MDNEKTLTDEQLESNSKNSEPSDERFADPQTDIDPRTSDTGMTSIGGYDVNADALPSETPGVRHEGGEETVVTPTSVNTNLKDDLMHQGA